jgi:hypothetical protein
MRARPRLVAPVRETLIRRQSRWSSGLRRRMNHVWVRHEVALRE